jgi:hypothetical protein
MTTETYSEIGTNRPSIPKDPNAVLDYTFDWTDWLALVSDTISTVTVTGAGGVTIQSSTQVGALVTAWVSGGVASTVASVTCRIVTAGGRTEERTIYLLVQER